MNRYFFSSFNLLAVIAFFVVSITEAFSQDEIRYTADILNIPAGADVCGLGDAGVVLPRRAVASWWNPAAASFSNHFEITAEIADLYHGLSQTGCFAARIPVQNEIGVSVVYVPFFSGDIPLFDKIPGLPNDKESWSDGIPRGYFKNNQNVISLAMSKIWHLKLPRLPGSGYPLPLDILAGGGVKGFWQMMNPRGINYYGAAVNVDAGVIASIGLDYDLESKQTSRKIMIAAAIKDFLPNRVIWINSPENYVEKMKLTHSYGIAYEDRSGQLGGNWTVALSLKKQYEISYHAGIEAEFWNTVTFRAGISDRTPTLGAGIHYKKYFIDYAFRFDKIDFSYMRLTLGFVNN
ncbi:MAG: hypothetical protein GX640_14975 [Fibrobacter sp.]|nr:hypothetical protein [Fibrobacter sp.]